MILILLITIISGIIFLIISSKYEVKYNIVENAYTKPKYSNHNYTSITFENGLKLVLVQIDTNDSAGGAISFDYGYLDNKYDPGYIKLAFLSLKNYNIKNDDYENYFGEFDYEIGKYYTSFYFQILGGGFKKYLKTFSKLTYIEKDDERFNNINESIDEMNLDYSTKRKKDDLFEYLIYGYHNATGYEIFPEGTDEIKDELQEKNYEPIKNLMRALLSDPTKIKIVLYSHYKISTMKKIFLNYFRDIINKPKINNINNQMTLNAYNIRYIIIAVMI